jgi:hypothetical protein
VNSVVRSLIVAILLLALGSPSQAAPKCAPVSLAVSGGSKAFTAAFAPKSRSYKAIAVNFVTAYSKACAEGLLKKRSLPSRLFLLNAPNANVASIYKSGGHTVLEYSFLGSDGKAYVPKVNELHETIFCAVHGASQKEQDESGRCLSD